MLWVLLVSSTAVAQVEPCKNCWTDACPELKAMKKCPGGATPPACPKGQARGKDTEGNCCWPGQAWKKSATRCVGAPKCPSGLVAKGERCAAPEARRDREAAQQRDAGTTRQEPTTGITWVWMPPGSFKQGCVPGDSQCDANEKPVRTETVAGFWMAKTETTVQQFEECVRAAKCQDINLGNGSSVSLCAYRKRGHFGVANPDRALLPMDCVTWEEASVFCRWAGGRLPTATEWEYAAKSGHEVIYPWGNAPPDGRRANSGGTEDGYEFTAPVGSFPAGASSWGLLDMAGNVWEWTGGDYDEQGMEARGGSWDRSPDNLRVSNRYSFQPSLRLPFVGFRCAQ